MSSNNGLRPVKAFFERTTTGARFNVETVTYVPNKHSRVSSADQEGISFLKTFYDKEQTLKPRIEATSLAGKEVVGGGSLMHVVLRAFDEHLPIVFRPDDIWILLTFAFAKHVDANAEALRSRFVAHEGKKVLEIRVDHFFVGETPPELWERDAFAQFSSQIREHIGDKTHQMLVERYSTTNATDQAIHEITLMAAMKNYFSYKMRTCCGIPSVELRGTEQDWANLRQRAEDMLGELMPEYTKLLIPVLDEFAAASRGIVNLQFWQSMCKIISHGRGSGSYSTVSGWFSLFYPYMTDGPNKNLRPWESMESQHGPEPSDFPTVISSVPVEWDYLGTQYLLHFHAGMFGIAQDPDTLALSASVGWIVSHDPPQDPAIRLQSVEKEIADITQGDALNYKSRYWLSRLQKEADRLRQMK